jgi:hypothetical protein
MGQIQTGERVYERAHEAVYEGVFFCKVYDETRRGRIIGDPSNHFFRIDDSSWEKINMLMERHILKTVKDLRLNGLECGFGGDEGDGFVRYKSSKNITDIPPMFFTLTTAHRYKLGDFELSSDSLGEYRMDFIKKQDE